MTWIVATPTRLGYAVALSDIRVTWKDSGTDLERDCLQKIYPVGSNLDLKFAGPVRVGVGRGPALGFAGSVHIGFRMLSKLKQQLRKSKSWTPEALAESWSRRAKEIFAASCSKDKKLGCQLLLIGVHPTEEIRLWAGRWTSLMLKDKPRSRSTPLPLVPKSFVYRFLSPSFKPEIAGDGEILSIGCGRRVEPYKKLLAELSASLGDSGWTVHEKGIGLGLAFNLTKQLQDFPRPGISAHLQLCTVLRGEVEIVPGNQHNVLNADGTRRPMPPVKITFKEFEDFEKSLRSEGISVRKVLGSKC